MEGPRLGGRSGAAPRLAARRGPRDPPRKNRRPRPATATPAAPQLRAHLSNLRMRLFQHISDAFDERRAGADAPHGRRRCGRGGDGGAGRWAAVRRRFAAVFGAGGAGSRDAVGSALLELHDEVTAQVGSRRRPRPLRRAAAAARLPRRGRR